MFPTNPTHTFKINKNKMFMKKIVLFERLLFVGILILYFSMHACANIIPDFPARHGVAAVRTVKSTINEVHEYIYYVPFSTWVIMEVSLVVLVGLYLLTKNC